MSYITLESGEMIMSQTSGMDSRSLDYVLGVEDCATMVYDHLKAGKDPEELRKAIEELLVDARVIRSSRFLEENGLSR